MSKSTVSARTKKKSGFSHRGISRTSGRARPRSGVLPFRSQFPARQLCAKRETDPRDRDRDLARPDGDALSSATHAPQPQVGWVHVHVT